MQAPVLGVDSPIRRGHVGHSTTTRIVRSVRSLAPRTCPPWASESAMNSSVSRAEPLSRQDVGDPGRVGGERLGGDPPARLAEGDDLLRPEEGVARGHLRRSPGRRRRERRARLGRLATQAGGGVAQAGRAGARRSRGRSRRSRRRRRSRSPRRARARCRARREGDGRSRSPSRRSRVRRPRAAAGPRRRRCEPRRSPRRARRGRRSPTTSRRSSRSEAIVSASSSGPSMALWRRAASSEAVEQRARAGRLDQRHGAVDDALVEELGADVEDRRLGQAAAELVDGVEDDVGAAGEGVGGELGGEGEMGAPRLVDDERHAAGVGDLGRARRRRRRRRSRSGRRRTRRPGAGPRRAPPRAPRASCSGRRRARRRSRVRRSAASGRDRTSPSITDEWTLRWTIATSPRCARAMQAAWLPPEAPLTRNQRAPRAPGLGGEALRALERRVERIGPDVDVLGPGREVQRQRFLADAPRPAPGPRRSRPCARECGTAPARARRARRARRDTGCRSGPRGGR